MTLVPVPQHAGGLAWETDEIERSTARMARIGSCRGATFSPDGQRLAFVSDLNGIPQVWTIATQGGFPELVTTLDDQVGTAAWSPDGAWIAFTLAPGGGMNEQVYLVRPDGTSLRRLTPGRSETNRLGRWTPDGRALIVGSNRRDGATIDPYLVDPVGGGWRLVREATGIAALSDVSRDGHYAIETRQQQRGDNNLYLLDLTTDAETLLTPHDGPATFQNALFAPDGRTIYLASNGDGDRLAFAQIPLDPAGRPGHIATIAARDDAELQEFALSPDGISAALIWNVAGRSELAFCTLATGAQTPGPALPGEVALGPTFYADGRTLALTITGAAVPMDIWTIALPSGQINQVTRSPHAGVALGNLVTPELVRFAAHDGLELSAWLYRPHGSIGPVPTVLSFHGGPEAQERPLFNATYQALLAHGIAVCAPNVRGSSGFGKRFVNLDNGALRHDAVRDILTCADYVVSSGVADAARLGIMGGSYGGYMTMAGLADYPDRFAAGANLYGVVNFETFFAHTEPWMAAISKAEYGDPATELPMLRDLSPIHRIDRVTAPTLVLHGANDTNVPVIEAEQVVEALRRRGIPTEFILFPDEGHGFRKIGNRIWATSATVRWFVEHLHA